MMSSLLRIMYAPLDYVHPLRFQHPTDYLSPALQQAINHSLIKRHQLPTALDFTINTSDFSDQIVANWSLLPKVAWLLGYKLVRGSLAIGGQLATLPESARHFIALPLPCPAYSSDLKVASQDIELFGAHYLYQLKPHLPAALAQRLPLLFAPESKITDNTADMPIAMSLNRSLITFAFDYAKNYNH